MFHEIMRFSPLLIFVVGNLLHLSAVSARDDVSSDLDALRHETHIPGMAVAVVVQGRIVAAGASGVRRHGHHAAITLEDKFHIGSCTKSMTGTLAAILVKEGRIRWNSTVAELFPDLDIHPGYRGATLLQLVSNSGGVPTDIPAPIWQAAYAPQNTPETTQRAAMIAALLNLPPKYAPGKGHEYSNGGFTIAGAMLEKASGRSYAALLRERIFQPLGITTGGFGAPATPENPDQPWGHRIHAGIVSSIEPGPQADNPPAITPAGRVHLSILDFARYAGLHACNGRLLPLDSKDLDFLHAPVAPAIDYAVGWMALDRPWAHGKALHHSGSNTMNFAVMWLAPKRKFAVVATSNIDSPEARKACDDICAKMIRRYLPGRN